MVCWLGNSEKSDLCSIEISKTGYLPLVRHQPKRKLNKNFMFYKFGPFFHSQAKNFITALTWFSFEVKCYHVSCKLSKSHIEKVSKAKGNSSHGILLIHQITFNHFTNLKWMDVDEWWYSSLITIILSFTTSNLYNAINIEYIISSSETKNKTVNLKIKGTNKFNCLHIILATCEFCRNSYIQFYATKETLLVDGRSSFII